MISLGRETMTYKFYNSVFLSHGLDLSPDTEAATADQILPLVKCELGLAFLPQPMAAPSLLKKEIVQIPLKDEIPERQICLVYDSQHPMGAAARELKIDKYPQGQPGKSTVLFLRGQLLIINAVFWGFSRNLD